MDENINVMNKYIEMCYASVWRLVYKAQQTVWVRTHQQSRVQSSQTVEPRGVHTDQVVQSGP